MPIINTTPNSKTIPDSEPYKEYPKVLLSGNNNSSERDYQISSRVSFEPKSQHSFLTNSTPPQTLNPLVVKDNLNGDCSNFN